MEARRYASQNVWSEQRCDMQDEGMNIADDET